MKEGSKMVDVNNETCIVKLTRGDTLKLPYFINANTEKDPVRYILTGDDTLYFALMEPNQKFEDAILKKVYTSESEKTEYGDLWIELKPEDTANLLEGKYYYTFKLKTDNQDGSYSVRTTTPEREFWIL